MWESVNITSCVKGDIIRTNESGPWVVTALRGDCGEFRVCDIHTGALAWLYPDTRVYALTRKGQEALASCLAR